MVLKRFWYGVCPNGYKNTVFGQSFNIMKLMLNNVKKIQQ